jgi:hypothetical protein
VLLQLVFYGYPRYTKDIDILVEPSLTNGLKITKALREFGFRGLDINPEEFFQKGRNYSTRL